MSVLPLQSLLPFVPESAVRDVVADRLSLESLTVEPAKKIINDALSAGADADEVVESLRQRGWHFISEPWQHVDHNGTKAEACLRINGIVDDQQVVVRRVIPERSMAHMGKEGIASAWADLKHRYVKALVEMFE